MTISSSSDENDASGNNDGPKSDSDSSGVSQAALRLYRSAVEGDNTGGAVGGGADAGLKEDQDVPSSSSSDDDGKK